MRGRGLVAAQTLLSVFAGTEGAVALSQRLGDVYARMLASHRRLTWAGRAAHGG